MKSKVLVVDDEADFRQLIEYNLARQDFEIFTAASGLEALNEARRVLPDVCNRNVTCRLDESLHSGGIVWLEPI